MMKSQSCLGSKDASTFRVVLCLSFLCAICPPSIAFSNGNSKVDPVTVTGTTSEFFSWFKGQISLAAPSSPDACLVEAPALTGADLDKMIEVLSLSAPREDRNIQALRKNPLAFYETIMRRRKESADSQNFPMPELATVVEFALIHLARMWQLGQRPPLVGSEGHLLQLMQKMRQLQGRGYPYLETVLIIEKYIRVIDYLYFEVLHGEVARRLISQMNDSETFNLNRSLHAKMTDYLGRKGKLFGKNLYAPIMLEFARRDSVKSALDKILSHSSDEHKRMERLLNLGEVVLLPTFSELDLRFFIQSNAVPVYPLGLTFRTQLRADDFIVGPLNFFEHDHFHANLMEQRRQKDLAASGKGPRASYLDWQSNATKILKFIDGIQAPEKKSREHLKTAMEMVLFAVLHEGRSCSTDLKKIGSRLAQENPEPQLNLEGKETSAMGMLERDLLNGNYGFDKDKQKKVHELLPLAKNLLLEFFANKP